LCSVFRGCSLALAATRTHTNKRETPCLDLHEFSSRARMIISSPVGMVAARCFTTPVTTNASPKGLGMEYDEAGALFSPIAGCQTISRADSDSRAESGTRHAALAVRVCELVRQAKRTDRSSLSGSRQSLPGRRRRVLLDTWWLHSPEPMQRQQATGQRSGSLAPEQLFGLRSQEQACSPDRLRSTARLLERVRRRERFIPRTRLAGRSVPAEIT